MTDETLLRNVRAIGLFYYFGSVLMVNASISSAILLVWGGGWSVLHGRLILGLAFIFALGVFYFIVGRGLRQFRRWARTVSLVLCSLTFLAVPAGTIIGGAFLYVLIKGKHLFRMAAPSERAVYDHRVA